MCIWPFFVFCFCKEIDIEIVLILTLAHIQNHNHTPNFNTIVQFLKQFLKILTTEMQTKSGPNTFETINTHNI